MSQQPQPVPHDWVADLFRRFAVLYGAQRMAVMYPNEQIAATVAEWARQLGKFPPSLVAKAIEALPQQERAWPPTLPEFLAMVQSSVVPAAHRPALPVPGRSEAEIAAGREQMQRIRAMLRRGTA